MLPWFAAFDHVNYIRWGIVFLADMKRLPRTTPEVHQGFQHGDFVTKETKNAFNQTADNQALEHVNKSGKVAGGFIRITRIASGTAEDGVGHKDLGKARVRRDEDDVQRLMSHFKRYDELSCSHNCRCCK